MAKNRWAKTCDCNAPLIESGVSSIGDEYEGLWLTLYSSHDMHGPQKHIYVFNDGEILGPYSISPENSDAFAGDRDDLRIVCTRCGAQSHPE